MNSVREISEADQADDWNPLTLPLLLLLVLFLTRLTRFTRMSLSMVGGSAAGEGFDLDPSKVVAAMAMAVFFVMLLLWPRRRVVRLDRPGYVLFAFALYLALTLFWAYDRSMSRNWTLITFQWLLIYPLVISWTRTRADLHRWGMVILASSFLVFLAMVIEPKVGAMAIGGAVPGAITYSYLEIYPRWAILIFPFALHYGFHGRSSRLRRVAWVAVVANLITVYLSWRRAGPFGIVLVLAMYIALVGRRNRMLMGVAAVVAVAGVMALLLDPGWAERLSDLPFIQRTDPQDWLEDRRLFQYMVGVQSFLASPIAGIGLMGAQQWGYEQYGIRMSQHSIFLQLLAETGVIGFSIYGLFLLGTLKRGLSALRVCQLRGDVVGESWCGAAIAAFVGMIFWAQIQPLLMALPLYLMAGLSSVNAEVFRDRQG